MMRIVTHPSNVAALRKALEQERTSSPLQIAWFDIQENPHMEREKPTGRYFLPGGGRAVSPCAVRVSTPFVDYGPEDIGYLVFAGVITPETEALYYLVDNSYLRMQLDYGVLDPRPSLIMSTRTA